MKNTKKSKRVSGKTAPRCSRPFMVYHWTPSRNRKAIQEHGLVARLRSRSGTHFVKHLCFCRTPSAAWGLSGAHDDTRQRWDLWCCWSNEIGDYATRFAGCDPKKDWTMTEYQCSKNIPASRLWFVGSRSSANNAVSGQEPAR